VLNGSAFIRCVTGLGLVLGLQGVVSAEPINGQIGGQSQAAIRISVSVMPSFTVDDPTATTARGSADAAALASSSNIGKLRFDLIGASVVPEKAHTPHAEPNAPENERTLQHSNATRLLLVVPD
jgi:hypothetical protein